MSRWSWAAAALGVAFVALLWAPWFDFDPDAFAAVRDAAGGQGTKDFGVYWIGSAATAWDAGTALGILLTLVGLIGVAGALVGRLAPVAAIAAAIGTGVVVARIAWPPDDTLMPVWGAWCALGVGVLLLGASVQLTRARAR